MLKELALALWDSLCCGDLWGHLRAWWNVACGRVTPDSHAYGRASERRCSWCGGRTGKSAICSKCRRSWQREDRQAALGDSGHVLSCPVLHNLAQLGAIAHSKDVLRVDNHLRIVYTDTRWGDAQ